MHLEDDNHVMSPLDNFIPDCLPYRSFLLWFLVEEDIPEKHFFAKYGVQARSLETFLENCLYEHVLKMCLGWAAGAVGTPACISHARPDVFSPRSAVQTEHAFE